METQIAVTGVAPGQICRFSQSLDSAILVAYPCIYDRQISHQHCALDCIFADRRQLNSTFAFANRVLLIAEYGINDTKRAKCGGKVRLIADHPIEFISCAVECCARSRSIPPH